VRISPKGLEEILVVEEKRQIIEYQLKEDALQLARRRAPARRRQVRRTGEWPLPNGRWLLPPTAELTPAHRRPRHRRAHRPLPHLAAHPRLRLAFLDAKRNAQAAAGDPIARTPYFCPGCPHNQSTKVPEGSARWAASAAT
jgi:indolepyruvate ferredoxin oxidoreductase